MKMIAEYLEKAVNFERMASHERDGKLKADLLAQAASYQELAIERAEREGLPFPPSK
jgi:hypothetical protein